MEDYKKMNLEYYGINASEYQSLVENYVERISNEMNLFLKTLNGKKILDLGSGPGRDSLFFKNSGFQPLCVDISKEMTRLCKDKGLTSLMMDIENPGFRDESLDGIWAYTSLVHVPKNKIKDVLFYIHHLLKRDGIFFSGMKEGNFEGFHESPLYGNHHRFSSLYQDSEFKLILSENFEILSFSTTTTNKANYLNYLCKPI